MSEPVICKCGSKLFFESTWCQGYWKVLMDEHGNAIDGGADNLSYRPAPKTVRCAECGRRNRNPNQSE